MEVRVVATYRGETPTYETLAVEAAGGSRYKIEESPTFAPNLARGDSIALDETEKWGYRIIERAGNLCLRFYFKSFSIEQYEEVLRRLSRFGATLDRALDVDPVRLLVFTVPVSSGLGVIKELCNEIKSDFEVFTWTYGNVYSPESGRPSYWWLSPNEARARLSRSPPEWLEGDPGKCMTHCSWCGLAPENRGAYAECSGCHAWTCPVCIHGCWNFEHYCERCDIDFCYFCPPMKPGYPPFWERCPSCGSEGIEIYAYAEPITINGRIRWRGQWYAESEISDADRDRLGIPNPNTAE